MNLVIRVFAKANIRMVIQMYEQLETFRLEEYHKLIGLQISE